MPHALPVLALRAALAAFRAAQPDLPGAAGVGLRRACALGLTPPERRAEAAVDALRQRLAGSGETVGVVDYGAGTRGGVRPPVRAVAEVYRRAATGPAWGRFLFGLARGLRPARVLELGTNLGVGAAHLAGALALTEAGGGPAGRLVTLEGAPALADRAAGALAALGHGVGGGRRVEVVVGPFAETLPGVAARAAAGAPFDLVFVDGHHDPAAALGYLGALAGALAPGAVVVLDDVEPGRPVRRAWRRLRTTTPAFYAGKYGLLVPAPGPVQEVPGAPAGGAAPAVARVTPPPSPADA